MAIFDLDWWNETARVAKKNIAAIHDSGVDAFVVFVGAFAFSADRDVEKSKEAARTLAASGIRREQIRVRRIKV